jgi:hypothetical protein
MILMDSTLPPMHLQALSHPNHDIDAVWAGETWYIGWRIDVFSYVCGDKLRCPDTHNFSLKK